jgi:hypothetical protein
MEPINYGKYLPQVDALGTLSNGIDLGNKLSAQQLMPDKIRQEVIKNQRLTAIHEAALDRGGFDSNELTELMSLNPEAAAAYNAAWAGKSEEQAKKDLVEGALAMDVLSSGDESRINEFFDTRITAAKNAGNEEMAKYLSSAKEASKTREGRAIVSGGLQQMMYSKLGPSQFAKWQENLVSRQNNINTNITSLQRAEITSRTELKKLNDELANAVASGNHHLAHSLRTKINGIAQSDAVAGKTEAQKNLEYDNRILGSTAQPADEEEDVDSEVASIRNLGVVAGQGRPRTLQESSMQRAKASSQPGMVKSYRDEFKKVNEDQIVVDRASESIANLDTDTALGQHSMIYQYFKTLDPNSTVMVSEFQTVARNRGVADAVVQTFERLVNGESLTPEQVKQIKDNIGVIREAAQRVTDRNARRIIDSAAVNGVSGDQILGPNEMNGLKKRLESAYTEKRTKESAKTAQKDEPTKTATAPKEGATKTIGGVNYTLENGKWKAGE